MSKLSLIWIFSVCVRVCAYLGMCVCVSVRACMCAYLGTCVCVCVRACMHVCLFSGTEKASSLKAVGLKTV